MSDDIERNLGEQHIAGIMEEKGLGAHALVEASTENITHKMVARACKGRRLTRHVQFKILRALNKATDHNYDLKDLFNY